MPSSLSARHTGLDELEGECQSPRTASASQQTTRKAERADEVVYEIVVEWWRVRGVRGIDRSQRAHSSLFIGWRRARGRKSRRYRCVGEGGGTGLLESPVRPPSCRA